MSALANDLLTTFSWLVPTSVFVAGVVGSPHCAAMCGPLVMAFGRDGKRLALYQLGRMLTYTAMGAIAGGLGHALLGTTSSETSSRTLSLASLLVLALLLLVFALRGFTSMSSHASGPRWLTLAHSRAWSFLKTLAPNPLAASFFAGALTVFLPCLHLYAFVTGAAATGTALGGAVFMFTFWLSTLPALAIAPFVLKRVLGATSTPRARRWAAGLFVVAAFFSLAQFATRLDSRASDSPAAHEAHGTHETHAPMSTHHHH